MIWSYLAGAIVGAGAGLCLAASWLFYEGYSRGFDAGFENGANTARAELRCACASKGGE